MRCPCQRGRAHGHTNSNNPGCHKPRTAGRETHACSNPYRSIGQSPFNVYPTRYLLHSQRTHAADPTHVSTTMTAAQAECSSHAASREEAKPGASTSTAAAAHPHAVAPRTLGTADLPATCEAHDSVSHAEDRQQLGGHPNHTTSHAQSLASFIAAAADDRHDSASTTITASASDAIIGRTQAAGREGQDSGIHVPDDNSSTRGHDSDDAQVGNSVQSVVQLDLGACIAVAAAAKGIELAELKAHAPSGGELVGLAVVAASAPSQPTTDLVAVSAGAESSSAGERATSSAKVVAQAESSSSVERDTSAAEVVAEDHSPSSAGQATSSSDTKVAKAETSSSPMDPTPVPTDLSQPVPLDVCAAQTSIPEAISSQNLPEAAASVAPIESVVHTAVIQPSAATTDQSCSSTETTASSTTTSREVSPAVSPAVITAMAPESAPTLDASPQASSAAHVPLAEAPSSLVVQTQELGAPATSESASSATSDKQESRSAAVAGLPAAESATAGTSVPAHVVQPQPSRVPVRRGGRKGKKAAAPSHMVTVRSEAEFVKEVEEEKERPVVVYISHKVIIHSGAVQEAEIHWKTDPHLVKKKRTAAELITVLDQCAGETTNVKFVHLHADTPALLNLCQELEVPTYPSLQFWKKGEFLWDCFGVFNIQRGLSEGLLYYADTAAKGAQVSPYVPDLHTAKDVKAFVSSHADQSLTVVGYFMTSLNACVHVFPAMYALAKAHPEVSLARVLGDANDEIWEYCVQIGLVQAPTFVFYKMGEEVGRFVGGTRADLIGQVLRYLVPSEVTPAAEALASNPTAVIHAKSTVGASEPADADADAELVEARIAETQLVKVESR